MRCRDGVRALTLAQVTRDGLEQVAVFASGCTVNKHCDQCDDYSIIDANGHHIATLHNASQYRCLNSDDAMLGIFKIGSQARDGGITSAPNRLRQLNEKNAQFWNTRKP